MAPIVPRTSHEPRSRLQMSALDLASHNLAHELWMSWLLVKISCRVIPINVRFELSRRVQDILRSMGHSRKVLRELSMACETYAQGKEYGCSSFAKSQRDSRMVWKALALFVHLPLKIEAIQSSLNEFWNMLSKFATYVDHFRIVVQGAFWKE